MAEFQTRKQEKNETWHELATNLKLLADKAWPHLAEAAHECLPYNDTLTCWTIPKWLLLSNKADLPPLLMLCVAHSRRSPTLPPILSLYVLLLFRLLLSLMALPLFWRDWSSCKAEWHPSLLNQRSNHLTAQDLYLRTPRRSHPLDRRSLSPFDVIVVDSRVMWPMAVATLPRPRETKHISCGGPHTGWV